MSTDKLKYVSEVKLDTLGTIAIHKMLNKSRFGDSLIHSPQLKTPFHKITTATVKSSYLISELKQNLDIVLIFTFPKTVHVSKANENTMYTTYFMT